MDKEFILELNTITTKTYTDVFNLIKDINNTILGLKLLINIDDLIDKYKLDKRIQFILETDAGDGKMKYYFNGNEIKPISKYMGVEREASLLEILEACTLQEKHNPDIKHLQVKNLKYERDRKLNKLI